MRKAADPDKLALLRIQMRNERARRPADEFSLDDLESATPPPRSGRAREVDLSPSGGPRKPKRKPDFRKAFANAVLYAKENVEQGRPFEDARELVGLYAMLHEKTFGILPLELNEQYGMACVAAKSLIKNHFDGNCEKAERFVAWCWRRVRSREKRREEGEEAFRPGWRLQFKAGSWLTDYRVATAKKAGRG